MFIKGTEEGLGTRTVYQGVQNTQKRKKKKKTKRKEPKRGTGDQNLKTTTKMKEIKKKHKSGARKKIVVLACVFECRGNGKDKANTSRKENPAKTKEEPDRFQLNIQVQTGVKFSGPSETRGRGKWTKRKRILKEAQKLN